MTDRVIRIREPLYEICDRLGLEPHNVKEMTILPDRVSVLHYKTNQDGYKYVVLDSGGKTTNQVAIEELSFRVLT
jgi:hypothetical protein